MIAKLLKVFCLIVLVWAAIPLILFSQPAEIIEDFIPEIMNVVPYMVKQGSDGNVYMTTVLGQGPGSLPCAYSGYCILNPQGQVVHYASFGIDLAGEMGWYANKIFCLNTDNSFRMPYIKTIHDTSGYSYVFKWANYNPLTGHAFTEGFHSTTPIFSFLQNVIQLNANRWIVTGQSGTQKIALCVNADGDSLWSCQLGYNDVNHDWAKRISDDRLLVLYNNGNGMYSVKILDDNGQELWSQSCMGFGGCVLGISLSDGYLPESAIITHGECNGITYVRQYNNLAMTELFSFSSTSTFFGPPNLSYNSNGMLITAPHNNTMDLYDIQGTQQWSYAMPDSFYLPGFRYQICKSVADSCYLVVGVKYIGYDPVEQCSMFIPYLLKLPFNLVSNSDEVMPLAEIKLSVYPNPFYSHLKIEFETKTLETAEFSIYNVKGQLIRKFDRFITKQGRNEITWDGKDFVGRDVVSGMYLIQSNIGSRLLTKKCLLLKK